MFNPPPSLESTKISIKIPLCMYIVHMYELCIYQIIYPLILAPIATWLDTETILVEIVQWKKARVLTKSLPHWLHPECC